MYTNHTHTILVLWYLISALMLGMHQAIRCLLPYLTRYVESTPAPVTLSMGNMSFSTPSLLDTPSIWDFYDKWDQAEDELLEQSIATYEAEMDREWEDEIQGYMFCDIATMMVLSSEDDPYEDLPFTASMRRSAKVGKSGINYALNCGTERSIHNAGDKDRK